MESKITNIMEKFITLGRMLMYSHHHVKGHGHHMHSPYRGQGRILSLLKLEPKMSQKKLSFLLGIRPQSMGELLIKLEQNGDIVRTPSEEDKRALDIQLTEKGMDSADENENLAETEQNREDIFSCLSAAERASMESCMDKLIDELKSRMPEDHQALFQEHMMHHHMHHHHEGHHHEHEKKHCLHRKNHGHDENDDSFDIAKSEKNTKKCPICKNNCDLTAPKCKRGEEYAKKFVDAQE